MENVYPPPWKFLCKIKQIPTDGWGLGVIIGTLAYHPMNQKIPTDGWGLGVIKGTLAYHPMNQKYGDFTQKFPRW